MTPAIETLDRADQVEFERAVAPLFEGAPRFLARLGAARPFRSWDRLFDAARAIAHAMPEPEQAELVDAHPRLGAPRETVSALSFREQGYDRASNRAGGTNDPDPGSSLAPPGPDATLRRLNAAYEERFGFRYCVFVAGRPLESLIPELEASLDRERGAELHRALDAVVDIARARRDAGR